MYLLLYLSYRLIHHPQHLVAITVNASRDHKLAVPIFFGVSRAPAAGGGLPMLQLRHYITRDLEIILLGIASYGACFELATVQPCTTSWIHKVTGKRIDRPCTDSLTPVKH